MAARQRNGLYELLRKAKPDRSVALSEDQSKILGESDSLAELRKRLETAGHKKYVLCRTPLDWARRVLLSC